MHDWERGQLDRLIEYPQVVETITEKRLKCPNYTMILKSFIHNMMCAQPHFCKSIPELEVWYESSETDKYYETYDYNSRRPCVC